MKNERYSIIGALIHDIYTLPNATDFVGALVLSDGW